MMLLISFLCTAVASAQAAGSRYLFTLATEAVTRSMFGVYDTRLWEQYRILALTEEALAKDVGKRCADAYETHGTLFSMEITSVERTDPVMLTDQGAKAWQESAVSYMEAKVPVELASQLLEQVGVLEDLEQMMDWISGLKDWIQPILTLEKRLCQLEKSLSQAIEIYQRGKDLLEELREACAQMLILLEQGETMSAEELNQAWDQLEDSYEQIQEYVEDSGWQWEQVTQEADDTLEQGSDLLQTISAGMEALQGKDANGLASLANLGGYVSGLRERMESLKRLPSQLSQQKEILHHISRMDLPSREEVLAGVQTEAIAFLEGLAEGFWEQLAESDSVDADWGSQTEEDQGSDQGQSSWETIGLMAQLRDWLHQGILTLVVEDVQQVSTASLGRTLPRSPSEKENGLELAYEKVLYGEYALDYTAHYGQAGGGGLQYETEHLIAGKGTDTANLATVASRLLLVRGAMNLVYLMQHQRNQESLQVMAAAICTALGGWIPQGLMVVLLMVLWAMAEAVCDVRALLAGKTVAFWKEESSWKLAFEHLWTILEEDSLAGLHDSKGMSYEGYLRLFLLWVPVEEACYRTMEVAEENLRQERPSFCMDQALYQATITVTGQVAGVSHIQSLTYGYH